MIKMLTPKEIAEVLHVNYETALAFVKYAGIPYTCVGNRYRVAQEHLEAFLLKKGAKKVDLLGATDITGQFSIKTNKK